MILKSSVTQRGSSARGKATKCHSLYIAQLQRVVAFYYKQESDAQGWIKDAEKLKVVLAALQERKETARRLANVLARIEQCDIPASTP